MDVLRPQHTIASTVELEGRGLFTGQPVWMRMRPAEAGSGIVFISNDEQNGSPIRALIENVVQRARRTALRSGRAAVETVEHCLSACSGLEIDNLEIELKGGEIPGVDGSCMPFVEILQKAGICDQDAVEDAYVITDTMRVVDGSGELVALPPLSPDARHLQIHYSLDYGPTGPIGRQLYTLTVTPESFVREIAPARTFVLKAEADMLLANGMGKHLTYKDILVFGDDGPLENTLRFPDEPVRHKILDLIGDLSLFGRPIIGRVYAHRSGHSLNHELVRELTRARQRRKLADQVAAAPQLDVHHVQRVLPHRYPFLMVDRVLKIEGATKATGIKNVTINEAFFQGHYPGQPIMPGVLILESMAQLGGILLSQELEHKGKVAVLLSLDKAKFRRPVSPGDQLILRAGALRVKSRTGHVRTTAHVGDELVAEAFMKFMLTDAQAN